MAWAPPEPSDDTPGNNGRDTIGYTVEGVDSQNGDVIQGQETGTSPQLVQGLKNGRSYAFTVRARNIAGTGPRSAPTAPVKPAGVPFPPREVRGTSNFGSQAEISWLPPAIRIDGTPGNNGEPILNYRVTWTGGSKIVGDTPSTTVDGLENGTSYMFTIQAINLVGISVGSISPGSTTPRDKPSIPLQVRATARDGFAVISWDRSIDNGAQVGYVVIATPGGASVSTFSTNAIVDELTNGQEYTFTVTATNLIGTLGPSSPSMSVRPISMTPPQTDNN